MKRTLTVLTMLLATVFSAYADVNQGLVGYYLFNGNANDSSGYNNHGSVIGAELTENRYGLENSAFSFDGIDGYVQLPSSQYQTATPFTYSCWVKLSSFPSSNNVGSTIFSNYTYSPQLSGNIFYVFKNGFLSVRTHSGTDSNNRDLKGVSIPLDKWTHVAVTFNGQQLLRVFINGAMVGEGSVGSVTSLGFSSSPTIGKASWWDDDYFHGNIDDLRIYNRFLSNDEIEDIYDIESSNLATEDTICDAVYNNGDLHIPCVTVKTEAGDYKYDVGMRYVPSSSPMGFELIRVQER